MIGMLYRLAGRLDLGIAILHGPLLPFLGTGKTTCIGLSLMSLGLMVMIETEAQGRVICELLLSREAREWGRFL
jgi:hypothetical protein